MAQIPGTGWVAVVGAAVASVSGWIARHIIQRVDHLERNTLTKEEFQSFCRSRDQVDAERSGALERIEEKVDRYHQDVTARVDRILERK